MTTALVLISGILKANEGVNEEKKKGTMYF